MKIDWIMVIMNLGTLASDFNNVAISSFYPEQAHELVGVKESVIGLIFASYSLGMFASTLIVGRLMTGRGRKKAFAIAGMVLQVVASVICVFLQYITDYSWFVFVSLVSRIALGVGQGVFISPMYSFLPVLYRDSLEDKIAVIECMSGFGMSIGPLVGAFFFEVGGWSLPFIANAVMCAALIPLCQWYIPAVVVANARRQVSGAQDVEDGNAKKKGDSLDDTNSSSSSSSRKKASSSPQLIEVNSHAEGGSVSATANASAKDDAASGSGEEDDDNNLESTRIKYRDVMRSLKIVLAFLSVTFLNAQMVFLDPTLESFVKAKYDGGEVLVGLIFFTGAIVYIACCPASSWLSRKTKRYKLLLFVGILISGFGMVLVGPDEALTHLPTTIVMPFIAESVIGIGNALIFVPVIPDMMDSLEKDFPEYTDEMVGDISSTLFNAAFSLGAFIGPLIAGFLVEWLTFPRASSTIGLFFVLFGLIYAFIENPCRKGHANSRMHELEERTGFVSENASDRGSPSTELSSMSSPPLAVHQNGFQSQNSALHQFATLLLLKIKSVFRTRGGDKKRDSKAFSIELHSADSNTSAHARTDFAVQRGAWDTRENRIFVDDADSAAAGNSIYRRTSAHSPLRSGHAHREGSLLYSVQSPNSVSPEELVSHGQHQYANNAHTSASRQDGTGGDQL